MTQEIQPTVTIVTITYNLLNAARADTFVQCVESVRNQSYKNIEHLVIDGASDDGTLDLLKKYADLGWIRLISEPDTGIYDAMNKGIKQATGHYIAFLNSDDYYHEACGIEASVIALENAEADFSYAPVVNYDETTGVKQTCSPDISKVFFSITPNHQTMLFKRSVLIVEGMFNTDFRCIADYDMTIRLCLKKYRCVFVETAFTTYRLGGFSLEASKGGLIAKEAFEIYFRNYKKLCTLTIEECNNLCMSLFHAEYANVPFKLASSLIDFEPYFKFNDYKINNSLKHIFFAKLKSELRRIRTRLKTFLPQALIKVYYEKFH